MKSVNVNTKILFIKYGNFSNANSAVLDFLQSQFPNFSIDVVDIKKTLKSTAIIPAYFINIYFFLREYGLEILLGAKEVKKAHEWFLATSYISQYLAKRIQLLSKSDHYLFTFQTQSLFNGKLKETPNFIYTDHTTRTNLLYPHIDPRKYMRSNAFIEKCEKKMYEDATLIFTFGSLVKKSLVSQYGISGNKIHTVFTGSNTNDELETWERKVFSKSILFVGVDWERKGGPILLQIFEKVLSKHSDAKLIIVGCKPKKINLANCTIVGEIPVAEIAKYYQSADLFCLPTLREPFGMVFIEAMSHKLPIVANNIGCISDLVINGYNGYVIDNDVQEYADAICRLFDAPATCALLGENGYQLAKTEFTWDKVGHKIKKRIEEALNQQQNIRLKKTEDN